MEAPIDDNFPYSINDFIDDMVKARQECIRFHEENPGIFIDTVCLLFFNAFFNKYI